MIVDWIEASAACNVHNKIFSSSSWLISTPFCAALVARHRWFGQLLAETSLEVSAPELELDLEGPDALLVRLYRGFVVVDLGDVVVEPHASLDCRDHQHDHNTGREERLPVEDRLPTRFTHQPVAPPLHTIARRITRNHGRQRCNEKTFRTGS